MGPRKLFFEIKKFNRVSDQKNSRSKTGFKLSKTPRKKILKIFFEKAASKQPLLTSEVKLHLIFQMCMSRAFQKGKTLAYWL